MAKWKEYNKGSGRQGRMPRRDAVSIGKDGNIAIANDLYARMGAPPMVKILYDEERQLIGLRPSVDENDYRARDSSGSSNGVRRIAARGVLQLLGHDHSEWRIYPHEWDDDILIVRLDG